MRRRRDAGDGFSLSYLDVICCGFGAVVLLLVLSKIGEPRAIERAREDLDGLVARLQEELHEIVGETDVLEREMRTREEQVATERAQIARLQGDLTRIQGEFAATRQLSEVHEIVEGRLVAAQEELTDEMQRLLGRSYRRPPSDATIGGIPVDSEYVVFVIDTSGSMYNYSWSLAVQKMSETLDIYPKVKGIQVMNDMGQYMFSHYAGKWIPDTPGRRKAILERLRTWNAFSNSSPVEGITRAIRAFAAPDKKISIYVFGDEFTGSSIDEVVHEVARMNRPDEHGERPVRIHGVGFPVVFATPGVREYTGERFATLMRILCRENGGAFVGLNEVRP